MVGTSLIPCHQNTLGPFSTDNLAASLPPSEGSGGIPACDIPTLKKIFDITLYKKQKADGTYLVVKLWPFLALAVFVAITVAHSLYV